MPITSSTDVGGFTGKDFVGVEIQWNGDQLTKELREKVNNEIFDSAKRIASDAKNRASSFSITGEYAKSIEAQQGSAQGTNLTGKTIPSFVKSGQSDPRRVGSFIEKGTGRTQPHPTILPAYDKEKPNLERNLTEIL